MRVKVEGEGWEVEGGWGRVRCGVGKVLGKGERKGEDRVWGREGWG